MTDTESTTQEIVQHEPTKHPVVNFLDRKRPSIEEYCTNGVSFDQLSRTLATALVRNPEIADCTPESVLLSITSAARLGLDPTGERNSAHFIPYKNNKKGGILELSLMVGYGGLISLILRNTDIIDIQTEVVFKGEHFIVKGGTEQVVEHNFDLAIRNTSNFDHVVAAYAVATFKDGHKKFVVLSRVELDKAKSSARGDSVWNYNPIEMAKKTPVRNMSKWLDIGPDFNDVIQISDSGDGYEFSNNRNAGRNAQSFESSVNSFIGQPQGNHRAIESVDSQ